MSDLFKSLQKSIQRIPFDKLLEACSRVLNVKQKPQFFSYYVPHIILFITKHCLINAGHHYQNTDRELPIHKFDEIINQTKKLFEEYDKLPTDYDALFVWWNRIAHQQFPLQENFNAGDFARQLILFQCPKMKSFHNIFESEFNSTIEHFLILGLALVDELGKQRNTELEFSTPSLHIKSIFGSKLNEKEKQTSVKLLDSLSLTLEDYQNFLIEYQEEKYKYIDKPQKEFNSKEIYETSPIKNFPLVKIQDTYFCLSYHLFLRRLENIIFDLLLENIEENQKQSFCDAYTKTFEDYLNHIISALKLPYRREEQMKKKIYIEKYQDKTCTDFLIQQNETNIFIESKAFTLHEKGKFAQNVMIFKDRIEDIFKALKQLSETYKELSKQEKLDKENSFFIIVTRDNYYLPDITTLSKEYKDEFDEIKCPIPLNNVFIFPIHIFESLAINIRRKKFTFSKILEMLKSLTKEDNHMSLPPIYEKMLETLGVEITTWPYLRRKFKNIMNNFQATAFNNRS